MRVMTLNMWGVCGPFMERWGAAMEDIPALRPDVLCLQEAADLSLLEHLGRNCGLELLVSDCRESGLAILTNLKPIEGDMKPYTSLSANETAVRKFQRARLEESGESFTVFNTHLSWKAEDALIRQKQCDELVCSAARMQSPVVLCGDFNAEIPAFQNLVPPYIDLLSGTRWEKKPTWDNANPYIKTHSVRFPDRRIDLILANELFLKHWGVRKAGIVLSRPSSNGRFLSDHYGVLAECKRSV